MSGQGTIRKRRREAGIALLISIFILLLISVVAIALVVSSGTESSLAGNYRSATGVYYAALSGLEEARGRLLSKNSDAFATTNSSGFLPPAGTALNMGDTYYLINPVGGETITPWVSGSTYEDKQFAIEFGPSGFATPTNPSPTALSVWNRNPLLALNLPGPLYKWVRINAVSENSAGVDADNDSLANNTVPLYYDGAHFSNNPLAGPQVLELTALAVLPNGSQKIVQYLAAPVPVSLSFPAALTLDGNNVLYSAPTSISYMVSGNDHDIVGSCNPVAPPVTAVGYIYDPPDTSRAHILTQIPIGPPASADRRPQYPSGAAPLPSVNSVSVQANMQTVGGLNSLVQNISQVADKVINPTPVDPTTGLGTATQANFPAGMSSSNPMTIVVNGNLDLNGWHNTGYGLLVVTGELKYDPDASWKGIVLVIGVGKLSSSKGGSGDFHGAMLLANTVNTTTSPYTPLSPPTVAPGVPNYAFTPGSGGNGIYYSNCWIQTSIPSGGYKILSFHEVAQQ
jgi:hypothetical protein